MSHKQDRLWAQEGALVRVEMVTNWFCSQLYHRHRRRLWRYWPSDLTPSLSSGASPNPTAVPPSPVTRLPSGTPGRRCGWRSAASTRTYRSSTLRIYRYFYCFKRVLFTRAENNQFFKNYFFFQENHEYLIRIFARNEVGLSEPLESEEPFKVSKPTGRY